MSSFILIIYETIIQQIPPTSSEQVIDNPYDLFIGHLNISILVELPVFTVINEGVCDVTDVVLK